MRAGERFRFERTRRKKRSLLCHLRWLPPFAKNAKDGPAPGPPLQKNRKDGAATFHYGNGNYARRRVSQPPRSRDRFLSGFYFLDESGPVGVNEAGERF